MAKKQAPEAKIENPEGVKSVYCNNMQVHISAMDVRLYFNEFIINQDGITGEQRANVVMSVPHFVAMVGVLNRNLEVLKSTLDQGERPVAQSSGKK